MGFRQKTSTQDGIAQQNRRSRRRKSILCRGFRPKRRHRLDFVDKTAGSGTENLICVEVLARNVDIDWDSAANVDINRISARNVDMDWLSPEKPQVASAQIDFVSRFPPETSTRIGFRQQTLAEIRLLALPERAQSALEARSHPFNRCALVTCDEPAPFPSPRSDVICRRLLALRRCSSSPSRGSFSSGGRV